MTPANSHQSAVPFEMTGRGMKVAAALVRLSSTSLWRAPTVDLNNLTSTAYEISSITEQVSGDCIESFLGREKLPGWFLVEHQRCLEGQSSGLSWPSAALSR
jgi:hypothetical protein